MRLYECSYKRSRTYTKDAFGKLNFGYGGMMKRVIGGLHNSPGELHRADARVVYAKDNNEIVGWAILVDPPMVNFKIEAYFFVKAGHRRKGIGTKLMRMARKHWGPKFTVCPHDETSTGFFNSCSTN